MLQLGLISSFTQAVGNSCPPNHNVPWWMWATKLELSHSASHLHCYWLALLITLLAVIFLLTSATTINWENSVIQTDRKADGTIGNTTPTTKLRCLHHKHILHLQQFPNWWDVPQCDWQETICAMQKLKRQIPPVEKCIMTSKKGHMYKQQNLSLSEELANYVRKPFSMFCVCREL